MWLLVPEHLRLRTFDLLCQWSGQPAKEVEPRLALQLVNEACLCSDGIRKNRSLSQRGFELCNGLPFLASDKAIHELLNAHSVHESQGLQVGLGLIRKAAGHFKGKLIALDPHRVPSYSKRQSTRRVLHAATSTATKTAQTFFCLDVDTSQPVAFTIGSSSRTIAQASPELLSLAADVLNPQPKDVTVLADTEHFNAHLFHHICLQTPFHLLTLVPKQKPILNFISSIPSSQFTEQWAGYATTRCPYRFAKSHGPELYLFVDRSGLSQEQYSFTGFLSTQDRDELDPLTVEYPKRWHCEEFFNAYQDLGWRRAGTLNLNIRYGQMSMALLAQAATFQLRQRFGSPFNSWSASHFAQSLLQGLDGDIRVSDGTILVTLYNPPHGQILRQHLEHLPAKLRQENVDPHIPWLYGYMLDFRFK